MQALIDQRATLSAHPDGREQSFPSAVLEVDENTVLLDGSPMPAVNRNAASAGFLLCFAQVDKVMVRFRVEQPQQQEQDGHVAFRVELPEELYHMQRRELYRLETPVGDSPWCSTPDPAGGEPLRWRAVDISAGGIALLLPAEQQVFKLQQRHAGCVLELPDGTAITTDLVVCSLVTRTQANGVEQERVGLRFEELPRGADAAIQRYIFRIDRERKARLNGDG
ncbi:Flagellar brake protein YcgR [uncultured Stenotrophomonas sp.]|uniref:Flagellar brake protein YcgR n=1 Tax=uncultured Stenotrophomonas sp. TaxID=165438 RepID=A0A1Y5Q1M2_9GAMM|nr:Flagellar brake protein YcgR [uncultured Stenotrophomonas sp.]